MTRALVLGGGGPVGIAWESGLLAGFAEKGVDLSSADYIIGTSAGSVVGAQLALGATAASLVAPMLASSAPSAAASAELRPTMPTPDLSVLITKLQELVSGRRPPEQARAEIGAWALTAQTMMSEEVWVANFARMIPEKKWPNRRYECTAIDTADGSLKVWNKDSGIELERAVASSCAVPGIFPPVTIQGRRYMDGGMRSPTNADLAKGYDTIVVVAVTAGPRNNDMARRFGAILDNEVKLLCDSGAKVELVIPDDKSLEAFGLNLMDSSRRADAAKAGVRQGQADAEKIASAWNQR
jgi:NTE family protein